MALKFGDYQSLLRLHEDMAARLGWSGDFTGQRRYLNEATIIAEKVPDPEVKIGLLQRRYVAEFHQGDLRTALKLIEEGITGCEASASALPRPVFNRLLRSFLLAKANVLSMMGKLRQARTLIDKAADLVLSAEKSKQDSRTTHTEALVRANLSIYTGDIKACLRDARGFVETLFWELQAQISLAGILLRRKQIKDQPRIAMALARAEELVAKTGGEVMQPFVIKHQAEFAKLKGDAAGHQRMLQEAHRLFISIEATGYAERLAAKLRDFESSSGAPDVET